MLFILVRVFTISDRFNENCVNDDGRRSAPTPSNRFLPWKKGANKKEKMKGLKKELEMDQHKIPLEELCHRLRTNISTVKLLSSFCVV